MSVERTLIELLPLANPAQDPDNTLKIPDFESGGPFRTTIWQKGTYSTFDDMATLSGIKCNGEYYAFASPVSLSNGFDQALLDAVSDVFTSNSDKLGGVQSILFSGPKKAKAIEIVSGVPFQAFMIDANTEFTGFSRSNSPYYIVTIDKASPVNYVQFKISVGGLTGGTQVYGLNLATGYAVNFANGPYAYSGVQATDSATASNIKADCVTILSAARQDENVFLENEIPQWAPEVSNVVVNDENSGFDITLKFRGHDSPFVFDFNGTLMLYVLDSLFTPMAYGQQVASEQSIV